MVADAANTLYGFLKDTARRADVQTEMALYAAVAESADAPDLKSVVL